MTIPSTFKTVGRDSFEEELNNTQKPVFVYFTEPSSNLCQLLDPEIEKVAGRLTGTFKFIAVNIDEHKDLSYELQIMRCPAFVLFRDGEEIRRNTDVNYSDDFGNRLRDFLIGDFHFDYSNFQLLDSMNFSARLGAGFQVDVVSFMNPGEPTNWDLITALRSLRERHQNTALFSLVNAYNSGDILEHFKINETPSVIAFNEGNVIKRWEPVTSVREFSQECNQLIG